MVQINRIQLQLDLLDLFPKHTCIDERGKKCHINSVMEKLCKVSISVILCLVKIRNFYGNLYQSSEIPRSKVSPQ